jgi:hypothetical protein
MKQKTKMITLLVSLCLITASTIYGYYSIRNTDDNNHNGHNTVHTKQITALEALNATLEYMDSKYEEFNLSAIHDFSHTTLENLPVWKVTYIIHNDDGITYEDISVFPDFRINSNTRTYTLDELLSYYYPWDIRGIDYRLVQIDSDEAVVIIKERMENETSCSYEYFSLHLECSLSISTMAVWVGDFYSHINGSYMVKIEASTGDILCSVQFS